MLRMKDFIIAGAAALLLHTGATVAADADARVVLRDTDGRVVGEVLLREVAHGALLHARLLDLPRGAHAFHIHAVGVRAAVSIRRQGAVGRPLTEG